MRLDPQLTALCPEDGFACIQLVRSTQTNAEWKSACAKGDGTSCVVSALRLARGLPVRSERLEMKQMLKQACDASHRAACSFLAEQSVLWGNDQNAAQVAAQNCEAGEPFACTLLQSPNTSAAFARACQRGDHFACISQADIELFRERPAAEGGHQPDWARAREIFQRACDAGLPEGCTHLGAAWLETSTYQGGPVSPRESSHAAVSDRAKARVLFERGCAGGDGRGCVWLGQVMMDDARTANDRKAACVTLEHCIETGACDMQTAYQLSECRSDLFKKRMELEEAQTGCESDDFFQCSTAADGRMKGLPGLPPNEAAGIDLLRTGCAHDDPGSCYELTSPRTDQSLRLDAAHRLVSACGEGEREACDLVARSVNGDATLYAAESAPLMDALDKRCSHNGPYACFSLAKALHEGRLWPADLPRANSIIERLCRAHEDDACQLLVDWMPAELRRSPEGIPTIRRACFAGSAPACTELESRGVTYPHLTARKVEGVLGGDRVRTIPHSTKALVSQRDQLSLIDLATAHLDGQSPALSGPVRPNLPQGYHGSTRWKAGDLLPLWNEATQHPMTWVELGDQQIGLWRPGTTNPLEVAATRSLRHLWSASDDGSRVAFLLDANEKEPMKLGVFEALTGRPLRALAIDGAYMTPVLSRDGDWVALQTPTGIALGQFSTGRTMNVKLPSPASAIAFDPKRPRVAVLVSDGIGFIDLTKPEPPTRYAFEEYSPLRFTPDGRYLVLSTSCGWVLLDSETGERVAPCQSIAGRPQHHESVPQFGGASEDGRFAIALGVETWVVDLDPARPLPPSSSSVPTWFAQLQPLPMMPMPTPPPILRDGQVSGTLRTSHDQPAPAELILTPDPEEWDNAKALPPIHLKTDAKGKFSMKGVPRINWIAEFRGVGWWGFDWIKLRDEAVFRKDTILRSSVTVHGIVSDPKGRPIPGVRVVVSRETGNVHEAVSDRRGEFTVHGLGMDPQWTAEITSQGWPVTTRQIIADGKNTVEWRPRLRATDDPLVIRARVRTRSGRALAGVLVNCLKTVRTLSARTDAEGRVAFDVEQPGSYDLTDAGSNEQDAERFQTQAVEAPTKAETLISIPDASLFLARPANAPPLIQSLFESSRCTPPNCYLSALTPTPSTEGLEWRKLESGAWHAWIMEADGRFGEAELELKDGERTALAPVFQPPARIKGRLIDATSGKPIAGAHLEFETWRLPGFGGNVVNGDSKTTSDANGFFIANPLGAGRHVIYIQAPGHDDRALSVATTAGQELDLGEIRLREGLRRTIFSVNYNPYARPVRLNVVPEGIQFEWASLPGPDWQQLFDCVTTQINGEPMAGRGPADAIAALDLALPAKLLCRDKAGKDKQVELPVTAWKFLTNPPVKQEKVDAIDE